MADTPEAVLSPAPPMVEQVGLYLDIMKRCLTDSIFIDHPLAHVVPFRPKANTPGWKRCVMSWLSTALKRYKLEIVEVAGVRTTEQRIAARARGADWPLRAHTMIGLQRLDNLQFCVETVVQEGIPGDLIETGVWRGGACIFMRAILKAYGDRSRRVWVADSFSGLPPPDSESYPADADDRHHAYSELAVSRAEVEENFRRYGLLDEQVRFLEGWFKDTLPSAPIERLAVLRLDGDMYESTIQALEALYDKLSPGGFVIVDDYFLPPCARAIHDFRAAQGITDPISDIDGSGSFWRRSR
jgi:O-methyltransferase